MPPRHELKYYIPFADYKVLSSMLAQSMKKDSHANGEEGYFVRSLYFDTLDCRAYYEKIDGVNRRMKIRLRVYAPQSKTAKFEIKNREGNAVWKEVAPISCEDAKKVMQGEYECMLEHNNATLNKIYAIFNAEKYRPVLLVEYQRQAYVDEASGTRITFDRCIRRDTEDFALFGANAARMGIGEPQTVVMELKFGRYFPDWIRIIINGISHSRQSISKFCLGMEGGFE